MIRCFVAAASVVSLLLSMATLALWVRSAGHVDGFEHVAQSRTYQVTSHLGVIQIARIVFPANAAGDPGPHAYSAPHAGADPFWSPYLGLGQNWGLAGFEARTYTAPAAAYSPNRIQWLIIPDWATALASATPPAAWLVRARRRTQRAAHGHCTRCGYDLRASKERCPECGTPMPTEANA